MPDWQAPTSTKTQKSRPAIMAGRFSLGFWCWWARLPIWHGVGGFMSNSSSSSHRGRATWPPPRAACGRSVLCVVCCGVKHIFLAGLLPSRHPTRKTTTLATTPDTTPGGKGFTLAGAQVAGARRRLRSLGALGALNRAATRRNNRVVTVVDATTPNLRAERYGSLRGLASSLAAGNRAIWPRPLLSATQSVPRAYIVDLKLASASTSA